MFGALDQGEEYFAKRVGPDTTETVRGHTYRIKYSADCEQWQAHRGGVVYSANESAFQNPKFWEIVGKISRDYCGNQYSCTEGETEMSFVKENEAMVITTEVVINGNVASKFSDTAIINMIKAEKEKVEALSGSLHGGSKYLKAKLEEMEANVGKLNALLDERV